MVLARNRSFELVASVAKPRRPFGKAQLLLDLGYSAGLLSLAALKDADDTALLTHCRTVAEILPIIGFYLQPAVGGRTLSYEFWRRFTEIENVVAIKVAPFSRYQTLDVVRAVAESGRDISLYTGNDDNIVMDLITPFAFQVNGKLAERRIVGGFWAIGQSGPGQPWTCCGNARQCTQEITWRTISSEGDWKSRIATRPSSTPPTSLPDVSLPCTKSCGGRDCWKESGA